MTQSITNKTSLLLLLLCLWILTPQLPGSYSQSRKFTDYQVKAATLLRYVHYIEWPAAAFSNENAPYIIAVLGENILNNDLEKMIRRKQPVNNRPIIYKHYKSYEEIQACHILFISSEDEEIFKKTIDVLNGFPTLIVGEREQFLHDIQHINFKIKNDNVKWDVSQINLIKSKLKASSNMLKIADQIYE